MEGPLSLVLKFGHPAEMLVSVLVGMGFGFALERAGFGTARNLAAVFYGRDFRVLRVMFTAIVTAMLGLYGLDLLGILPLSSIGILDTFAGGQLVGGLLVGAGFIVGGYCPGTSIVAGVSGKIDALLFMGGILVGTAAYTLGADAFAPLASSGAKGRVLLHEWAHVSSGVMVFAVALFAVGAFWAVGRIERMVRARLAAPVEIGPAAVPSRAAAAQERSLS
ncbi:YeeE/YedE thiosulfate transporter family protein [Anaeromyxobacter oryzae]|uniref:Sulphur transport domain-containing protein n=1 Tax=Anaeromyxobacter oryzae TaxID=2918170 RepID=A0ABM7X2K8_9BACT|nr:YeeE/YedE thiosulfate transporter family protein [Anaeromyxobacter oryzae]BDG06035.1 hypothetical protein AMOR_50310 [Anaeromyxobacter oryzae]